MTISLFILDADQKRKLIEIMIIVFSIMIILPGKITISSGLFGMIPSLFLILSIVYWIASHDERINNNNYFRLITLIISLSFSIIISAKLTEFLGLSGILREMVSWAYYLLLTLVIFLALTSSMEEKKTNKRRLSLFGKIIIVLLFIILLYLLSKLF